MNEEPKETNSENIEEIIPEKKIRVYPSEVGSWEYCNLKWLYERTTRKNADSNADKR